RSLELGEAMHETPTPLAAFGVREQPLITPARLVQPDESIDGVRRQARRLEAHRADRLRATNLAPDLVPRLLVERAEIVVPRAEPAEVDDRADVLLLDVDFPALFDRVVAEGCREQRQGRIVAAEATEVDHVPGTLARVRRLAADARKARSDQ